MNDQPKNTKSLSVDTSSTSTVAIKNYMLIAGVILTAIVLIGGYLIYWLAGRYIHLSNLNKAQDQLISALVVKQQNLQELKPNYEQIIAKDDSGVSDADLILQAVPTTQDYENLIAILEKMGQDSGVKVTNVSQSTDTQGQVSAGGAGAQGFEFTTTIEGSFAAILEFLKKTENSARVINFDSMRIDGNTGDVSANLTMTTFFQPEASIESTYKPLR